MTDGNGTKKRAMPVKTARLDLGGDYEGWWFTARTNPKMSLFGMLMGGTYNGMVTALGELAVGEWNFVDEEGEAMAQPHLTKANHDKWEKEHGKWRHNGSQGDAPPEPLTPQELIGQLTIDLIIQMSRAVGDKVQEVPGN